MSNNNLVLISGESATGKSACLRNIPNPEGVMYLCTEAGKKLPFKSKFKEANVIDPLQVTEAITQAETMPEIHTIVIDSLTFLLDQFETQYVLGTANTMKGWQEFQQFFKRMLQQYVAASTKNIIFTAHTQTILNEADMAMETKVPVKGALKANGIEAYFSLVISTKKMTTKSLEKYSSDLLNITEEEKTLGFKYVLQTKLTKETVNERIRAPMGMFINNETFIDNDIQLILDKVHAYYE